MSLRSTLTNVVGILTALALVAAGSLISLTTLLHQAVDQLISTSNSLEIASSIKVKLLTHARSRDPIIARELEKRLRSAVRAARAHVQSDSERAALSELEERIESYLGERHQTLDAATADGALESAFASIQHFEELNRLQAAQVLQSADRLNRLADVLGIGSSALLLLIMAGALIWLRRAVQPVFHIARTMKEFGRQDTATRLPEDGVQEFKDISRQFNEMVDTLKRRNEDQLTFLAGVAHDLKNPLTALRLPLDSIKPDRPLPSEERLRSLVALVSKQVGRLDRMIGDLLDNARIQAGRLELHRHDHDLRMLVQDTCKLFEPTSARHSFAVRLPDNPVRANCDPTRIEQVLNNLVSNAVKYSPEGGTIDLELSVHGAEAHILVRDPGIGIPPEELQRIFEPFRRSSSSKEAFPGVGLGLFAARRIVEAHGGSISVESTVGRGSTFRLCLPLAADSGSNAQS